MVHEFNTNGYIYTERELKSGKNYKMIMKKAYKISEYHNEKASGRDSDSMQMPQLSQMPPPHTHCCPCSCQVLLSDRKRARSCSPRPLCSQPRPHCRSCHRLGCTFCHNISQSRRNPLWWSCWGTCLQEKLPGQDKLRSRPSKTGHSRSLFGKAQNPLDKELLRSTAARNSRLLDPRIPRTLSGSCSRHIQGDQIQVKRGSSDDFQPRRNRQRANWFQTNES